MGPALNLNSRLLDAAGATEMGATCSELCFTSTHRQLCAAWTGGGELADRNGDRDPCCSAVDGEFICPIA